MMKSTPTFLLILLPVVFAALIAPPAQASSVMPRKVVEERLRQSKNCVFAVGTVPRTLPKKVITDSILCMTDVIQDEKTLKERLGCSLVRWDPKTSKYYGGKPLTLSDAIRCKEGGFEKLAALRSHLTDPPKTVAEELTHPTRQGNRVILYSDHQYYRQWWERTYPEKQQAFERAEAQESERQKKVQIRLREINAEVERCYQKHGLHKKWDYKPDLEYEQKKELKRRAVANQARKECDRLKRRLLDQLYSP